MNRTEIEWCDFSWNPITGCTPVSEGCEHCYAAGMARRFGWPWGHVEWFGERLYQARDLTPFQELKGRRRDVAIRKRREKGWPESALESPFVIFAESVSDLFHEAVPDEWIEDMIHEMTYRCPWHTFVVLTKRPERMSRFVRHWYDPAGRAEKATPYENLWLGVSAENQARAEERIPFLLDTPAAVRVVSVEPMLGPVDLTRIEDGGEIGARYDALRGGMSGGEAGDMGGAAVDWVLAGPETGAHARDCYPIWLESLESQAGSAGVPFFDKRKRDWARREFPNKVGG